MDALTSKRTYAALRVALLAGLMLVTAEVRAQAASNAVLAGIGGVDNGTLSGGDGTGTGRFDLESVELALVKQARATDGSVLPNGTDVLPGEEIVFVLIVENPADVTANDVRLLDPLDESQFTYLPGTLETTSLPAGADDATLWAATWSVLTDALGAPDDDASAVDTGGPPGADRISIGAEAGQANLPIDVAAGMLRAFRFHVRVN